MQIINSLIRRVLSYRMPQIRRFMREPFAVQHKTLHYLLRKAANTEWGRKYQYAHIHRYEDYDRQVPVSAYEEIAPYIERMMRGEQNVLWGSPIRWFSKSSGTTNARSKFIPVSQEALAASHFRGGRDIFGLYIANNPQTRFFRGKGLSIGGTFQPNPEYAGSFYGDISAVVVQNLPSWAQSLRTPPLRIAMMDKWEEKIEAMVKHTLRQDITSMLGVPTWTVVLLQRILETSGAKTIHEVWRNFEVFVHGAVAFTPYRDLFHSIAPELRYMETYNASEGFFGLQDDLSRDDMLLMLDYEIFYEFIPITELDAPRPNIVPLEGVELHKNYAMLISTSGGLWRYKIGDTVKFTSKYPYRIKITGRTKQFINAFGEEVIVENAEHALAHACRETQALVSNFTAGPVYMQDNGSGGHEWIIEFEQAPADLRHFTQLLDAKLREINSDYDAKRYQDIALVMPVVHHVPQGTFYNWLKRRGKLGGQNKVPRLANNREYLDDILQNLNSEQPS